MMQKDLFDNQPTDRHDNGVRVRRDGKGDSWGNEHRTELGQAFYFQDLDAIIGYMAFEKQGLDQFFVEYVPDGLENQGEAVRHFATVALFDRKKSMASVYGINAISLAYYLNLCRVIGQSQPVMPKFFFVVGTISPWSMVEVDPTTGQRSKPITLAHGEWHKVWDSVGLLDMRWRLQQWVNPKKYGPGQ